jgi:hypothetical protein
VFGADVVCFPEGHLAKRFPAPVTYTPRARDQRIASVRPDPPLLSPFAFLNSGTYMGYVGALRRAIRELRPEATDGDQRLLTRYFLGHPDRVSLDYGAHLFHTLMMLGSEDFVVDPGPTPRVTSRITGSSPCVLHGQGYGRGTLAALLEKLRASGWP